MNNQNQEQSKLSKLNDALFNQLDRLADPNNDINVEIVRADAIADISKEIISSGRLELKAIEILDKNRPGEKSPKLISPIFSPNREEKTPTLVEDKTSTKEEKKTVAKAPMKTAAKVNPSKKPVMKSIHIAQNTKTLKSGSLLDVKFIRPGTHNMNLGQPQLDRKEYR